MWVFPLWKAFHNGKTHLASALGYQACLKGHALGVHLGCLKVFLEMYEIGIAGFQFDYIGYFCHVASGIIYDECGRMNCKSFIPALFTPLFLIITGCPSGRAACTVELPLCLTE